MRPATHNGHDALTQLEALSSAFDRKLCKVLEATLQTVDLIDPRDAYIDENGEVWAPVGATGGTLKGLAVYRNEIELQRIRDLGIYLANDNEWGRNIHQSRIAYIVGWGHTYKANAKPDETVSESQLKEVNEFIATFLKANRWSPAYVAGAMQFDVTPGRGSWGFRQLQNLWRRDAIGESLIRKFQRNDGILRLRYVDSPALHAPQGKEQLAPFGIEVDPDDEETVVAYWVNDERIEANEIQHRTRDGSQIHPRGIPINYPVRNNLIRAQKILRNGQAATELQVAIGMIRKHTQATKASITSMISSDATRSVTDAVTGTIINQRKFQPGSILDTTKGVDYEFPAQQINPAGYVATLGADLRAIAACHVMPEFMVSADACFDDKTEMLTERGWQSIDTVRPDDKIGTFNPSTEGLEYQEPSAFIGHIHDGPMKRILARGVDVLVTHNHDLWIGQRLWNDTNWQKIKAADLRGRWKKWKVRSTVEWDSGETDAGLPHSDAEMFLSFLGVYLGDGCVTRGKRTKVIRIHGITKQRKVDSYTPLLSRMGFRHCIGRDGRHHWWKSDDALSDWLTNNAGHNAGTKRIPQTVQKLCRRLLACLWGGLLESDGHVCKRGTSSTLVSTSKSLIDDAQIIAIKLGLRAHVSTRPPGQKGNKIIHRLDTSRGPDGCVLRDSTITDEHYSGRVWCVTVPNGLVVTRRNGWVSIHGNSNANYSSTMVAEGPCVKNFEALQWDEISHDLELIWDALRFAVEAGQLSAGLIEKIEVCAEAPRVQTRDELKEAHRDEILNRAKVLSNQSWAIRNGLDYEQEMENFEEHAVKVGDVMDKMPLPPLMGAGAPGQPQQNGDDDERLPNQPNGNDE